MRVMSPMHISNCTKCSKGKVDGVAPYVVHDNDFTKLNEEVAKNRQIDLLSELSFAMGLALWSSFLLALVQACGGRCEELGCQNIAINRASNMISRRSEQCSKVLLFLA